MMNATTDSSRVENAKKFSNDNILQYLQELVGIIKKIAIQWCE